MHKKKSAVNHRRWFSADCLSIPFSESTAHVPFVLVQNTSQRASTIGDGSPLTVNYSLLKCTTHVPFVLVQSTSQRSSTIDDGLCLRSLNYSLLRCTTHVPFVLVQNTSQRASTIGDGSPLTVNYSLLKCTTHVPFVLVQNTSQRSSTIDDGLCLRSLNYSLLRCTTHVPFVLVQNTSQRFSPLVSSQPSHLWLSAVRRSPACLPACLPACRPQSSGKPFTSSKVRTNIPMYIAARLRQLETRRRPPHHASPSRERAAPLLRPQESEQQIADVGVGPHHLRLSRETVLVDMSVCCGQIY